MILLNLLRDLNVTLFKFYPIHWCFSTVWIFKGYRSQVVTTHLEMETCNVQQKYMLPICLYFWASLSVLPGTLQFSWHCHRIKPKGLQFNILSLLPSPTPASCSFTPCSHSFMPSLPETCLPSLAQDSHSPILSFLKSSLPVPYFSVEGQPFQEDFPDPTVRINLFSLPMAMISPLYETCSFPLSY